MFHTIAGLAPAEKVRLAAAILASLPHAQTISGLYGEPLTHLEDLADDLSRCSPDELIA